MTNLIDRAGPLPLYHQLKLALLDEIAEGGLRAGDQLPTEAAIESRYTVSRSTIRQALNELVAEGHVERIQGKGTFVAAPRFSHLPQLTSFTENMRAQGHVPSRRVEVVEERQPDPVAAAELELDGPHRCVFIRRTLLADGEPLGVADTWIPTDVLGGTPLDADRLTGASLYEVLQSPPFSVQLHHGHERITAQQADEPHAALLGLDAGSSVLVVGRVSRTPQERAVETTRITFDAARYEYRVDMTRPSE